MTVVPGTFNDALSPAEPGTVVTYLVDSTKK